ncbi:class I SAM-dependent methyltransferase [Stagnimonas aquatica]|nr:class I SAM-dependent methyltransferase [Stagnimonas aquatica]
MDASQFSSMPRVGAAPIPRNYWRWYVLSQLRAAISRALVAAGSGPGKRVVELGCGNRPYEAAVLATGAAYEGADLKGNAHNDRVIGDDGRVEVEDGYYDLVVSAQVLEHVPDPKAYLAESLRLLKPDGCLILSTHGTWPYHPEPNDYWRWTATGLRKTLEDSGFVVEGFEGLVGLIPAGLHLIQDHLYKRLAMSKRWYGKSFVWLMQGLIAAADRLHGADGRARDGMIYVVRARPAPRQPGGSASPGR